MMAFDLITTILQARRVYEHAIAISDIEAMNGDASLRRVAIRSEFNDLATAMGYLVTIGDQFPTDVEAAAQRVYRTAVSARALRIGDFDLAGVIAELRVRFAMLAASLGYAIDPVDDNLAPTTDDDAAMAAVEGQEVRHAAE